MADVMRFEPEERHIFYAYCLTALLHGAFSLQQTTMERKFFCYAVSECVEKMRFLCCNRFNDK